MATMSIQPMILRQHFPSSVDPNSKAFPEANSQDFIVGEPTYLVSGYLTKFAVGANNLLGMADDAAANDAAAQTKGLTKRVTMFNSNQIWEANVRNDDDGDADDAIAATDMGASFGIIESTVVADRWCINKADTTNKRVTIIGFVDAVGDIYGRVLFFWINAYLQPHIAN